MGVFDCFGGTPEKEKIQSLLNKSPAKLEKGHRSKRGFGNNPPVILEHAEAIAPNYDKQYCIGTGDEFSDVTIPARPGGSSLGSCGSTNVPHKHAAAGVLAWAHVDELAEEVAGLRRRLRAEEEHARRLAEEVVTLRSNGQDSGMDNSYLGSHQSGCSNSSEVRAVHPHQPFTREEGLYSSDEFEPKGNSDVSNETATQGQHDEWRHSAGSAGVEEADVQLPPSSASMGPLDDVADEEHHADLPMLHTEEQWKKLMRQGVRLQTANGKKCISPIRKQRRRGLRQPGSAPPGPIRSSREMTLMKSGEDEDVLTRRSLFRTEPLPWDSADNSADNDFSFPEVGEHGLAQGTTGARKLAVNMPTDMGGGDGDGHGDGDQSPTLCLGVGTGPGEEEGEGGESVDSKASADIQNVRGSPESDSSFVLAPPGSEMESLDSPNMGFGKLTHEVGLTEAGDGGDLSSFSIPPYVHLEQPAPRVHDMVASFSPSPSPCLLSLVDNTRDVSSEDWSYLPMAHTACGGEVEVAAVSPLFSELLYRKLSASQFSDSNDSPDLRGGISHQKHASPSSMDDEDTDFCSALTDSSFESYKEKSVNLPPRSELPFFPLTQDMLQVGLDNAGMSFTNPVYAEDV